MVTGVGATMPTGGVTVGATPPAQHVPQEAGQAPPQATPTATTTTRRSGENRRVSVTHRYSNTLSPNLALNFVLRYTVLRFVFDLLFL